MLRLLSHQIADGPSQMALDEALLEVAEVPTLRTYGWTEATVSLGCFQDFDSIAAALPGVPAMVRRITGGGAIWHEHEVTYCLIGRLGQGGLPERMRDCYPLLHKAILGALQTAGADLLSQPETLGDRRYRSEPRCFASPAACDLVDRNGGKALGSAGRDRGGRCLIHGSLKLASNPWDQDVTVGCGLDEQAARELLVATISAALGLQGESGDLSPAETERQAAIRAARYGDDGWLRRRSGPRP
jgi:lipoate-protein ligase A